MNQSDHYETKGKQEVLYGNATPGQILLITLLFLVNAALLLCMDNFLIHDIACDQEGVPALEHRVPGEILSMESMDGGYLILYQTPDGTQRIAKADHNALHRYRLTLDVVQITRNPYVYDGAMLDFTIENGKILQTNNISLLSGKIQTGLLIAICFALTALERMLLQKLRG